MTGQIIHLHICLILVKVWQGDCTVNGGFDICVLFWPISLCLIEEKWFLSNNACLLLACENSRPSSLPARVASFPRNATRAGSEEGRLFSQVISLPNQYILIQTKTSATFKQTAYKRRKATAVMTIIHLFCMTTTHGNISKGFLGHTQRYWH